MLVPLCYDSSMPEPILPPDTNSPWVQAFRLIRDEVKHEQGVLAGRLSSYITSQSFLISAYAVANNHQADKWGFSFRFYVTITLSVVGFLLSARARPGIKDASDIIARWHERQDQLLSDNQDLVIYQTLRHEEMKGIRRRDQWFAQAAAYIFMSAWIILAALSIILFLNRQGT
jgi:hypothetical protein